jgi:hypothetical protein
LTHTTNVSLFPRICGTGNLLYSYVSFSKFYPCANLITFQAVFKCL